MQDVVVADQIGQLIPCPLQTRFGSRNQDLADIFFDLFAHTSLGFLFADPLVRTDEVVVLGRHHDGMYPQRFAVIVIFDGDLTLGVGTQVGHDLAFAADNGQLLENDMSQNQGGGHELFGFVAGVTEHDALIAGALGLFAVAYDAPVDVGRLFVDGRQHAAGVGVEHIFAFGVADAFDDAADHLLNVYIGFRADLAGDYHQTGGTECFTSDFRMAVLAQKFVENGVGNLIRYLVGVPFGHRFGRK